MGQELATQAGHSKLVFQPPSPASYADSLPGLFWIENKVKTTFVFLLLEPFSPIQDPRSYA